MKIAIVQRRMDRLGGAERLVHDLAHGLALKGHAVDFFVYKYNEQYWGRTADQKYRVRFLNLSLVPKPFRILLMGLFFRFKLKSYDLINIHNTYVHHWMIAATLFNRNYPPVYWYCNEPRRETYYDVLEPEHAASWRTKVLEKYRFKALGRLRVQWQMRSYRILDKLAVKRFRAILANSAFAGRMIEKAFGVKPVVCHAGIRPAEPGLRPAVPPPYWLLVSRMVFHKNIDTVLEAMARIKERGLPVTRLVLAGRGPDLERLKELAVSLGLKDCTEFLGYVDDARLEALYAHADFFVYIPVLEPFGLTLIEAMKHGVPVIGARDGGGAEIVDPEVNGLLVEPQDLNAVEAAIERLLMAPALRQRLGKAAREKVEAYYSLEKFVERFERIVNENSH